MQVSKIKRLSDQHEALKQFHKKCCYNSIMLNIEGPTICSDNLDCPTTQIIISEIRGILLKKIKGLEDEIRSEAASK